MRSTVPSPQASFSPFLSAWRTVPGALPVVSSNTVQTTGENALSPTHELVRFYVDLYVDEQGYFRTE